MTKHSFHPQVKKSPKRNRFTPFLVTRLTKGHPPVSLPPCSRDGKQAQTIRGNFPSAHLLTKNCRATPMERGKPTSSKQKNTYPSQGKRENTKGSTRHTDYSNRVSQPIAKNHRRAGNKKDDTGQRKLPQKDYSSLPSLENDRSICQEGPTQ